MDDFPARCANLDRPALEIAQVEIKNITIARAGNANVHRRDRSPELGAGFKNGDHPADGQPRRRFFASFKVCIHEPVPERRGLELVEFEPVQNRDPGEMSSVRPARKLRRKQALTLSR